MPYQNPLLQKTEASIRQKVKPELQAALQRTVIAGKKVMYESQNGILVSQLSKSTDYAHNAGEGAAKLVGVLYEQSRKTMPISIMVPAAAIFLCEGLDFLEKSGKIQVTPDFLAEATQDLGASVLQLLGVTPQQMQQMIAQKQGQQSDQPAAPAAGGLINSARRA